MRIATAPEFHSIRAMRVDADARSFAASGGLLTHHQAQDLGDEHYDWIAARLGLAVEATPEGIACTPRGAQ